MKVVAFLQNQWVRDPDRVREMIARTPAVRPRLLAYALFQSFTGRRLLEVFGDDCRGWVWENASPQIGGCSSSCFPADPEHVKKVLEENGPDVVVAFGRVAERVLREAGGDFELICGPHPAARADDVVDRLREMRDRLWALR